MHTSMRYSLLALLLSLFLPVFPQPSTPTFEDGMEGIQRMMVYLLHASPEERAAFGSTLFPSREDCETIFHEDVCEKVYRYQRFLRRQTGIVVAPLTAQQTDFLIWAASTGELRTYKGEAQFFPGGYRELAPHMKKGITFYRIKFVQPGHKIGSAYDVLVYVNGNWRLFQRPWTVLF